MNIFKKTIFLGIISSAIVSTSAFAVSFNLKLGVDAKAGCVLGSEDFNFGNINQTNLADATWTNNKITLSKSLFIRCSQGTTFSLSQNGQAGSGGYDFNKMYLNGTPTALSHSIIQYVLKTNNVQGDNKYNIISRRFKNTN